jgi:hypothetical protein
MSEYRLTVTVSEHGRREVAEDRMEKLLDAFYETHPEVGAVVGSNYHLGHLDVTFSLDAEDAKEANERGGEIFIEAFMKSGLEHTKIVELNCIAVGATPTEQADAELVAA